MTIPTRAGVFDTDNELDVGGFARRPVEGSGAKPEQVRAVSETAQFQSREPRRDPPAVSISKRDPRRYRTGRNIQLNIKAQADVIEAFYALSDQRGWVLGETFERAIGALKTELAAGHEGSAARRVTRARG